MPNSKVTLADIAKEAGVSISTASRALANSPLISDKVKNMIKAIAAEKNYHVNRTAQNLRLQRTGNIAVVVPIEATDSEILSNPFVLEFLGAVGFVLRQYAYNMLLLRAKALTRDLLQSGLADGFIQLGHKLDPAALNRIAADTPFVVWGPPLAGQAYTAVGIDNTEMARRATQHLIAGGRRRIGIITGDLAYGDAESHMRFAGYRQALAAANIPYDPALYVASGYNPAAGRAATERLLAQAPDLDAIFAAHSDMVAIMCIEVLRGRGRVVPGDVAVIGFDNISMGEHLAIPLTSISQNIQFEGACVLIETLIERMDGQVVPPITVDGELVVRQSCGVRLAHP